MLGSAREHTGSKKYREELPYQVLASPCHPVSTFDIMGEVDSGRGSPSKKRLFRLGFFAIQGC